MGLPSTPEANEGPSANPAQGPMDDAFNNPTQLSAKESDERSNEVEETFGKIADFNQRGEDIREIETTKVAKIIKIDTELDPMEEKLTELAKQLKRTPKDEELQKEMSALNEKAEPLRDRRRAIVANYEKMIDGTLYPKLVETVRNGGSGNEALAAKMKSNVNVYENLREVNNALQWSPPPVGLGLSKDNLMENRSKLEKKAEEYWSASPSQWAAFKKKIDSIDTAFTAAKTGIEQAKRAIS